MSHDAEIASFTALIQDVTRLVSGDTLDTELQSKLERQAGTDSRLFRDLAAACRDGVNAGWLCNREHGGIKFGRIIKPGDRRDRRAFPSMSWKWTIAPAPTTPIRPARST